MSPIKIVVNEPGTATAKVIGEIDGTGVRYRDGRGDRPWAAGVALLRLVGSGRTFDMVFEDVVLSNCEVSGASTVIRFRYKGARPR